MSRRIHANLSFGGIGSNMVPHAAHQNNARAHAFSFRRGAKEESKSVRAEVRVQMKLGYIRLSDSSNFEVARGGGKIKVDYGAQRALLSGVPLWAGRTRLINNLILHQQVVESPV